MLTRSLPDMLTAMESTSFSGPKPSSAIWFAGEAPLNACWTTVMAIRVWLLRNSRPTDNLALAGIPCQNV